MKFHSQWGHETCPVMEWYSQQRQSSTRFQSIEHHRDLDGPFYHEFLLLKLTDGAVCRVERIGEGSRTDAIRYMGCTAHDLIQWFSKAKHISFSVRSPSELIAKVDLGREFDILDVLAVCYSVQNTNRCRAYTLQRYNCYFLCLTILAVLTRRVASWETKVKADEWDSSLASMHERWGNLPSDQTKQYAILTICAYLEPENPRPAQFSFNVLHEHLRSHAEGFSQCRETMMLTLWRSDWESGLRTGLIDSLCTIPDLFEDTGHCSQQLKRVVETSGEDAEQAVMSCEALLGKNYFKFAAEEGAKKTARTNDLWKNLQRLWHIEHPVSIRMLALSRAYGSLAGVLLFLVPPSMYAYSSYDLRLFSHISTRLAVLKQGSIEFTIQDLDALEQSDAMQALSDRATDIVNNELMGSSIVRILDRLVSTGVLPPSEVSFVLACWLNKNAFASLLASLAAPALTDMVSVLTEARRPGIQIALDALASDSTCVTVREFQEFYIKHRVADHARRVALHRLAAEKFVIEDVEEAMTEVWKALPSGFGACKLAPVDKPAGAAEGA
ncbi:hypothetical protein FRC09_017439 [Ceratobasidium sp. 395]|nr:hypothetical protein FRC09_017439 [Ceratobasidium sp. 395]